MIVGFGGRWFGVRVRGFGLVLDQWAAEGVDDVVGVDQNTLPAYEGDAQEAGPCSGITTSILHPSCSPPSYSPPSYEESTQSTPYGLVDGGSSTPSTTSPSITHESLYLSVVAFTSSITSSILAIPLPSARQLRRILFDSTTLIASVLGLLFYLLLKSEV